MLPAPVPAEPNVAPETPLALPAADPAAPVIVPAGRRHLAQAQVAASSPTTVTLSLQVKAKEFS